MAANFSFQSRSKSKRSQFRPNSEINVTPLVDVMLVLLIIFMVTAPILTVGVPVDLPKTTAAQTNDTVEPIVISINHEGKTFLKETEMPLADMISHLELQVQKNPEAKIYVRGDKKLTYGQIMEVMGFIASAGFQHVSLIAEMPTSATTLPTTSSTQSSKEPAPSKISSKKEPTKIATKAFSASATHAKKNTMTSASSKMAPASQHNNAIAQQGRR